jgi:hypothetical protein
VSADICRLHSIRVRITPLRVAEQKLTSGTCFRFINSLIFYDEVGQYARWVLVAVFLSMGVLIAGVVRPPTFCRASRTPSMTLSADYHLFSQVLLSLKSSAKATTDPYTVSTEPTSAVRLRPRAPKFAEDEDSAEAGAGPSTSKRDEVDEEHEGRPREDVLWEVGSVSDDGTEGGEGGEEKRKGIGGGDVRGERRGLLVDDEDEGDGAGGGGVVAVGTPAPPPPPPPPPPRPRGPSSGGNAGGGRSKVREDRWARATRWCRTWNRIRRREITRPRRGGEESFRRGRRGGIWRVRGGRSVAEAGPIGPGRVIVQVSGISR